MWKRVLLGFALGLGLGLAAHARATVPCGDFDQTLLRLDGVKKNGAAQSLPTMREYDISSNGSGTDQLFDPTTQGIITVSVQP